MKIKPNDFVIVTGLSGAGKSTVLRVLEDVGFFVTDNLPVELFPDYVALLSSDKTHQHRGRFALGMDARESCFIENFQDCLGLLALRKIPVKVLFLEAREDVLLRRYSESRRRHPLAPSGRVRIGLSRERHLLEPLRGMATHVIDTTHFTVHDLRRRAQAIFKSSGTSPSITVMSFGYRYGLPLEADLVFDVRYLPNPHFVPKLRPFSGQDIRVRRYVLRHEETHHLMKPLQRLIDLILRYYVQEAKSYVTIGIGCTGGRHRSVVLAEEIGKHLKKKGYPAIIQHRDISRETTAD